MSRSATWFAVVTLATVAGGGTASGAADLEPAALVEAIRADAAREGAARGLILCRAGLLRYHASQAPAGFAFLRADPSSPKRKADAPNERPALALFRQRDRLWRVALIEPVSFQPSCEAGKELVSVDPVAQVNLNDLEIDRARIGLTLFDRELVIANESTTPLTDASTTEWRNLETSFRSDDPATTGQAALIPVLSARLASGGALLPRTRNYIVAGAPGKPGDAAVDVRASLRGKFVRVCVAIEDDAHVPAGAEASSVAQSDHVEIAYRPRIGQNLIRLVVAHAAAGTVLVRRVDRDGPKASLPTVTYQAGRRGDGRFTFDFSASELFDRPSFAPSAEAAVGFAVAFFDVDAASPSADRAPETVIATRSAGLTDSEAPFSSLSYLPEGARFPRFAGGERSQVERLTVPAQSPK